MPCHQTCPGPMPNHCNMADIRGLRNEWKPGITLLKNHEASGGNTCTKPTCLLFPRGHDWIVRFQSTKLGVGRELPFQVIYSYTTIVGNALTSWMATCLGIVEPHYPPWDFSTVPSTCRDKVRVAGLSPTLRAGDLAHADASRRPAKGAVW